MKNILVIDGNSIINRAYYGVRPLSTKDGRPTNAVFGTLNIIGRQLEAIHPDYAAVAFDVKSPTFRHKIYDAYKAGRRETPEDLLAQFAPVKECLAAMGLTVLELPGYEADDIQGTVSAWVESLPEGHAYILSGDRDLFQLIDDRTTVLYAGQETKAFDRAAFREKYPGIEPEQFVDLKALMGDASDNIPGVAGVGEKTALKLIAAYGSIDGVYAHIEDKEIANGVREKLKNSRDNAYLSLALARILREAPLTVTLEDIAYHGMQSDRLYRILSDLELNSIINRLHLTPGESAAPVATDAAVTYREVSREEALTFSGKFAFQFMNDSCYLSDGTTHVCCHGAPEAFAPLFTAPNEILCYDGKKLWHTLQNAGIRPIASLLDISLYAYVADASLGTRDPQRLAADLLGKSIEPDAPYAHILPELESALYKTVCEHGAEKLLTDVELPLLPILAEMETVGFRIDTDGLRAYGVELNAMAEKYAASVQAMAGHPFNLNSPKQLGEVLFEEMKLPAPKKKKSGYSTDAETLEKLKGVHPIAEEILLYRQLSKLYSTYAVGLLTAADATGRLHTDFKQSLTATGRLSSAEPNLQNIPIRTPAGREFRRYFIPSDGYVLVDADYSQIELRLLAILSGDEAMIRAFTSGTDIHTMTAASAFRIPPEEVTPALRKSAKAINFGIVYGISAFSLSQDLHISVAEAKEYIEHYMQTYPAIRGYLESSVEHAAEVGYTETLYGRRRYIPELKSANGAVRALGRRMALNAPLQGTAADIVKMAMVRVARALAEELPSARMIMQVHDELVLECPPEDADRAAEILRREMEGVGSDFPVPLTVDVEIGHYCLK